MGKPTATSAEPNPNPTSITHFSHPHPLHLVNPQISPCSACKLPAATAVYACLNCNFLLHPKCTQLPQQIRHPFDEKHALTLYPKPVYPEGLFNCDACGNTGAAFSYHCTPCGVDLHTTCASLPINFTHQCHPHPLILTFAAPYPGNTFSCDICKKLGTKTWIYRCAACEFDVHLTCVAAVIPERIQPHVISRSYVPATTAQPQYGPPQPAVAVNTYPPTQPISAYPATPAQQSYGNVNQPAYLGARPVNRLRDQMAVAAVEGITGGIAQSATTALFQGIFGGGGGGGGGGDVSRVDVVGMDSGGATVIDGGSCYEGGYGGVDGGGDVSY